MPEKTSCRKFMKQLTVASGLAFTEFPSPLSYRNSKKFNEDYDQSMLAG